MGYFFLIVVICSTFSLFWFEFSLAFQQNCFHITPFRLKKKKLRSILEDTLSFKNVLGAGIAYCILRTMLLMIVPGIYFGTLKKYPKISEFLFPGAVNDFFKLFTDKLSFSPEFVIAISYFLLFFLSHILSYIASQKSIKKLFKKGVLSETNILSEGIIQNLFWRHSTLLYAMKWAFKYDDTPRPELFKKDTKAKTSRELAIEKITCWVCNKYSDNYLNFILKRYIEYDNANIDKKNISDTGIVSETLGKKTIKTEQYFDPNFIHRLIMNFLQKYGYPHLIKTLNHMRKENRVSVSNTLIKLDILDKSEKVKITCRSWIKDIGFCYNSPVRAISLKITLSGDDFAKIENNDIAKIKEIGNRTQGLNIHANCIRHEKGDDTLGLRIDGMEIELFDKIILDTYKIKRNNLPE